MVRHLAYCTSRDICQETKRQKTLPVEDLPDYNSSHASENDSSGYGIARATNESHSWMDSDESTSEDKQRSEEISCHTDTEGEDCSKKDTSYVIKNEMNIGPNLDIRDTRHEFEVDILSFCNKIDAPL